MNYLQAAATMVNNGTAPLQPWVAYVMDPFVAGVASAPKPPVTTVEKSDAEEKHYDFIFVEDENDDLHDTVIFPKPDKNYRRIGRNDGTHDPLMVPLYEPRV